MQTRHPLLVLGSRGMLGKMVFSFFNAKKEFIVSAYDERFSYSSLQQYSTFLSNLKNTIIINCIGRIKQKTSDLNDLMWANSIFPLLLINEIHKSNFLIQPSTDCVFSGKKKGPFHSHTKPDAIDEYGWSKRLGEEAIQKKNNSLIIRVSIIGSSHHGNGKDLISWFLSNKEKTSVNGYTNHLWNGITTLEWCKQIEKIILAGIYPGLIQMGTDNYLTKENLLNLVNKIYCSKINIIPSKSEIAIDRRLYPDITCNPIEKQLVELYNYDSNELKLLPYD